MYCESNIVDVYFDCIEEKGYSTFTSTEWTTYIEGFYSAPVSDKKCLEFCYE